MMSRKSSARTAGPLSIGFPEPLKTRPAPRKHTTGFTNNIFVSNLLKLVLVDGRTQHVLRDRCP